MDRRKNAVKESRTARGTKRGASPPASRTRSKSPARVESSGRDSAAIVVRRGRPGRPKKTDTPLEEISSSSQSSTPQKELQKPKKTPNPLDDSGDNEEVEQINTRSTRLASLRKRSTPVNYKITPTPSEDQRRSISRSVSALTREGSDSESDDVEIISPRVEKPSNFLLTLVLIESLIILPIVLHILHREQWNLPKVVAYLRSSASYCNTQSGSFFLAYLIGTALLSLGSIGRTVKLPGSNEPIKFNGLFSAIVILGLLFGLELKGLDSFSAIYNNIDRFLLQSIITNLALAAVLFFRAKRQPPANPNPLANGKWFVRFAAGLEVNPRIYNRLDVKAVSYHRSIIMILILNIALLFKNISLPVVESSNGAPIVQLIQDSYSNLVFIVRNSEYNSASLVISGLLVIYALDALIFEHHLAASYQTNSEGCGAELLLRFATFPFLLSILPRFLLQQKLDINCYLLTAIALVFIVGLVVKRSSNCLKYDYRLKPFDAKFKGKLEFGHESISVFLTLVDSFRSQYFANSAEPSPYLLTLVVKDSSAESSRRDSHSFGSLDTARDQVQLASIYRHRLHCCLSHPSLNSHQQKMRNKVRNVMATLRHDRQVQSTAKSLLKIV